MLTCIMYIMPLIFITVASSMFPSMSDIVVTQPILREVSKSTHYNAQFLEIALPALNMTVIAVRGTGECSISARHVLVMYNTTNNSYIFGRYIIRCWPNG